MDCHASRYAYYTWQQSSCLSLPFGYLDILSVTWRRGLFLVWHHNCYVAFSQWPVIKGRSVASRWNCSDPNQAGWARAERSTSGAWRVNPQLRHPTKLGWRGHRKPSVIITLHVYLCNKAQYGSEWQHNASAFAQFTHQSVEAQHRFEVFQNRPPYGFLLSKAQCLFIYFRQNGPANSLAAEDNLIPQ